MLEKILQLDTELFLFLNGKHSPYWDEIMINLSDKHFWLPLYGLLIAFIIYKFKWDSWKILLSIGLIVVLADQVSSGFFKPFFERFRPSWEPSLEGLVHMPDGKGGRFGFFSSHAANTFGFTTFIALVLREKWKYLGYLLVIWAAVVSYSRIYLGVHYPLDIICGMIDGVLTAFLIYKLLQRTKLVQSIL